MKRPVVMITGASSGLGLETAVYLAKQGYSVVATMRDLRRRGRLEKEAARVGAELHCLQLDVTDRDSIEAAVQALLHAHGRIDALINNAGVLLRGYFEDLAEPEIRRIFETNVFGTMAVTRAVLRHMRMQGHGRIVIITSIAGQIGSAAMSAYCASKFALEGFGEALALEAKLLGIDVTLIEPGIVNTDIWTSHQNIAQAAHDERSPYAAWFRELEQLTRQLVASAPTSPQDVAAVVHRALVAKRPRLRYLIGYRASLVLALRRYLPGEMFDRVYFGAMNRRITRTASG